MARLQHRCSLRPVPGRATAGLERKNTNGAVMKILVAEPQGFSPLALGILQQAGEVELADPVAGPAGDSLAEAGVLWVRLRNRIDAAMLDEAPHLKIIASPTTGLNHIDLEEAA